MTQSDKLIRFSSLSVDVKEPMRAEIQTQIDAWLAAGNVVQVIQPFGHVPKPAIERTIRLQPQRKKYDPTSWDDSTEIKALRFMKAQGIYNKDVAKALNEVFNNGRTTNSVRSYCARHNIDSVSDCGRKPRNPWLPEEDELISRLSADGYSHSKIAHEMKIRLTDLTWERSWQSIRGRLERLELTKLKNSKGRK